jgi:hypothetical protein
VLSQQLQQPITESAQDNNKCTIIIIIIIQKLYRRTREMLTIHGQYHPKADIDRLYIPRKDGGRGLMQIEGTYITEVTKLKEYVKHTEDTPMQIVRTHQHNTSSSLFHTATSLQKSLQNDIKQIKTTIARNLKERWEAKRLHGQFPRSLDEGFIDKEQSYRWLKFGDIKGETESVIMAAQDQAISTNYFKKKF